MIGSKFSRHFINQSEVKPKPMVARAYTFSRDLCRLRVITSSFDWFSGLSPPFLIGQSNYFGLLLLLLLLLAERSCLTSLQPIRIRAANEFSARAFPVWKAKRRVLQRAVCHLAALIDNNVIFHDSVFHDSDCLITCYYKLG